MNSTAGNQDAGIRLDDDLVQRARAVTSDLNGTLDRLLRDFVEQESDRQQRDQAAVERLIDVLNAYHDGHGLLSDDYPIV